MGNRAYTGLSGQAYPSGAGGSAGSELQNSIHSGVLNDGTVNIVGLGVTSVSFLETAYDSNGETNTGTTDIVPILSSNTSWVGGLAFGTAYNATTPPWQSFDNNMLSSWATVNYTFTPSGVAWVGIKLPVKKCVNRFVVSNRYTNGWQTQAPKNFTFEGSNVVNDGNAASNDSDWDLLGTYTNQENWSPSAPDPRTFWCINGTEYKYYRLRVTEVNGHSACAIANWTLIEAVLVGGVAYNIQAPNPAATYSQATPEGEGEKTIVITNKSGATQSLKIYYVA
jgi:hypothetical protein